MSPDDPVVLTRRQLEAIVSTLSPRTRSIVLGEPQGEIIVPGLSSGWVAVVVWRDGIPEQTNFNQEQINNHEVEAFIKRLREQEVRGTGPTWDPEGGYLR